MEGSRETSCTSYSHLAGIAPEAALAPGGACASQGSRQSPCPELPLCPQHPGRVGVSAPVTAFFRNTGSRTRRNPCDPCLGSQRDGQVSPALLSPGDSELLPLRAIPSDIWSPWDISLCPSQARWPIWERALPNDDSVLPGEVSPPRQPSRVRVQFSFPQHRGKNPSLRDSNLLPTRPSFLGGSRKQGDSQTQRPQSRGAPAASEMGSPWDVHAL